MRLSDVDTWELAGFQNQLICHFMLSATWLGWYPGICEYCGQTSIPGKGAGGIGCGWVPICQSSRPCKWNGAH